MKFCQKENPRKEEIKKNDITIRASDNDSELTKRLIYLIIKVNFKS